MLNVFLDTSIYISEKYNVYTGSLVRLKRNCELGLVQLFSSDIVIQELQKHISEDSTEAMNKLKTKLGEPVTLKIFGKDGKLPDINGILQKQFGEYMKIAKVIPFGTISVIELFDDYFSERAPFENRAKKKTEFPDAVIIKSIKKQFKKKDETLFVVTKDEEGWIKAFTDNNKIIILTSLKEFLLKVPQVEVKRKSCKEYLDAQKESILEKAKEWLEEYEWITIIYKLDDTIDVDDIDEIVVKNLNLNFDGFELLDDEKNFAVASFTGEALIDAYYGYEDHTFEIYDKEDKKYYNTKINKARSQLKISFEFTVEIVIEEKGIDGETQLSFVIKNYDFDAIDDAECMHTELSEDYQDEEPLEYFAAYTTCPDCGRQVGIESDSGNCYCKNCASAQTK